MNTQNSMAAPGRVRILSLAHCFFLAEDNSMKSPDIRNAIFKGDILRCIPVSVQEISHNYQYVIITKNDRARMCSTLNYDALKDSILIGFESGKFKTERLLLKDIKSVYRITSVERYVGSYKIDFAKRMKEDKTND